MADGQKLQVHYRFLDSRHAMDALVRNRCEAELLAIAFEIAAELDIDFSLESQALEEGSLKEIWEALGKNQAQVALIISIMAFILALTDGDPEMDALKKEETKLSIEQKKLSIQKIKQELQNNEADAAKETATKLLIQNQKVLKRRSNFYSNLQHHERINSIGYSTFDSNNAIVVPERVIPRADFPRFILHSDTVEPLVVDEAIIEIVSPVLGGRRNKWRGIYNKVSIPFSIKDRTFLNSVESGTISFRHGSEIRCVLRIERKLDETGEIIPANYKVETVLETIDGEVVAPTQQGKVYRQNQIADRTQKDLFDGDDDA